MKTKNHCLRRMSHSHVSVLVVCLSSLHQDYPKVTYHLSDFAFMDTITISSSLSESLSVDELSDDDTSLVVPW